MVHRVLAAGLLVTLSILFTVPQLAAQDRNCSDFRSWAEAQAFFISAGPGDPNHLDRDGDGIACETLPGAPTPPTNSRPATPRPSSNEPRATATRRAPTEVPPPTVSSRSGPDRPLPTPISTRTPTAEEPPGPAVTNTDSQSPLPTATAEIQTVAPAENPPPAPDPSPAAASSGPPSPLRLLILQEVPILTDAGETAATAQPGETYPLCGIDDRWALVALDGGCVGPGRIEIGLAVQLVAE